MSAFGGKAGHSGYLKQTLFINVTDERDLESAFATAARQHVIQSGHYGISNGRPLLSTHGSC